MAPRKKISISILFIILCAMVFSVPSLAADKPIGTLTEFSGNVIIKSQGSWGVEPSVGLPLYSGDKVVTRTGIATITFSDGAVMEIKSNSNLLLEERNKKKGFLKKVAVVERRLRLLVGKLFFKTGRRSNTETRLETPTMVCGLRGTAGVISIGSDGQPYIQFSEGGSAFTIGDFISGVAEDVPAEIIDLNPAQRAAFVAKAAADQAKNAAKQASEAAAGTPEADQAQVQAAYAAAQAAELAAEEVKVAANLIIENNPDTEMVQEANAAIAQADNSITAAQQAQQDAVKAGATPGEPEPYEPPEGETVPTPGFDIPVTPEPDILDSDPGSPI